jgi:hypothetical protein
MRPLDEQLLDNLKGHRIALEDLLTKQLLSSSAAEYAISAFLQKSGKVAELQAQIERLAEALIEVDPQSLLLSALNKARRSGRVALAERPDSPAAWLAQLVVRGTEPFGQGWYLEQARVVTEAYFRY